MGERAIEALRHPALEQARGLPASLYTSREFFDIEQRRLFPRTWVGIAFDTDVPAPGDAIPLTVCGLPVILARDHNGDPIGFEIDVAKKVAEDMGVDINFVPTAWDGIIPASSPASSTSSSAASR